MEDCNIADISSVIAEFPLGDDNPKSFPIKKLQMSFDDLIQPSPVTVAPIIAPANTDTNMRVYVRIRPLEKGKEGTVRIVSDSAIVTTAPEASRRAQYTKTEERQYVSFIS